MGKQYMPETAGSFQMIGAVRVPSHLGEIGSHPLITNTKAYHSD